MRLGHRTVGMAAVLVALGVGLGACGSGDEAVTLGEQETAAIRTVAPLLLTFGDLSTVMLDVGEALTAATAEPGRQAVGTCPAVESVTGEDHVDLTLTYAPGCTAGGGEQTLAGVVSVAFTPSTNSGTVTFEDFAIDGRAVTGTVGFTIDNPEAGPLEPRVSTVDVDLTYEDAGRIDGLLTATFSLAGVRFDTTDQGVDLTDPANTTYTIYLNQLRVDVGGNGNAVPEFGTASFDIPNEGPGPDTLAISIRFDAQSPATGRVYVSVNDSPELALTLSELLPD